MTEMFSVQAMNPVSTVVLWQGTSNSASNIMSGGRIAAASYVVTEDAIRFARGVLSTREEFIPLVIVRDCDIKQSISQKARGVGDLGLKLDGQGAQQYGQAAVQLISIKEPQVVRDLIMRQANHIRAYWTNINYERQIALNQAGANQVNVGAQQTPAAPAIDAAPAQPGFMEQLTKLGEMKSAGLLTDEEFAAAKAKLLA